MRTHSKTSKYKMLVLMDKSKASQKTLIDAVNFAKLIDGSLDIFQVEPPTNVVRYENQIASMRAIDEERQKQDMMLKAIVSTIKEEESLPVVGNFTFGNVKNEIQNHIEKTKPDIVVLGKRKKKVAGLLGDQITEDLVNNYAGTILISGSTKGLATFNDQSIGFLNTIDGVEKDVLITDLQSHIKRPLKIFKNVPEEAIEATKVALAATKEQETKQKAIIYEFDAKNNSATDMANFISKNNLAFLCVQKNAYENKSINGKLDKIITKTLEKTNIPVLVLNSNLN